jgi:tripartite-type tricarboxylate transporter receptor subunit TctC
MAKHEIQSIGGGMKSLFCTISVAIAVLAASTPAVAQPYPTKPIRMVVPFSPGGGTDLVGRLLAREMSELLGQSVIVDNRTGAGGHIGIEIVARSNPDGYTALFINQTIATNESVHKKLNYNALRDFAPVSRVGELQFILSVHPSLPVNSVVEFTAYAWARPGKLTYASGGLGGVLYFAAEMYKSLVGIDVTHVPYRGGGDATTAVLANQVTMVFTAVPVGASHIQAGRLKGLGITGATRSPLTPQIPTMVEAGVKGYEFTVWNMLLVPVGTPKTAIAKLHQTVVKALQSKSLQQSYAKIGVLTGASTSPEEAGAFLKAEVQRYAKLVRYIGLAVK